jgi:hypothetical protein
MKFTLFCLQIQLCFQQPLQNPLDMTNMFFLKMAAYQLVLATGPGNPPAVRCLASGSVPFGSKTAQKPELQCLGSFVTRTGYRPAVFGRVVPAPLFQLYRSCNFRSN